MNITEAITKRKSIRAFKPDPVSKSVLTKVLDIAVRAPSAMNTQPWEFVVLGGERLSAVRQAIVEKLHGGAPMQPDHLVVGWPRESVYRQRQVDLAKQLFKLMDIQRDNTEKRAAWLERGFRFFDAPAAIIIVTDRVLTEGGPLLDIGAVMQNICLAAMAFDLGTCIEDQGVLYPEVLREQAGISDQKRIMIAIAIGYPDWTFPANQVVTGRAPVTETTTWIGVE